MSRVSDIQALHIPDPAMERVLLGVAGYADSLAVIARDLSSMRSSAHAAHEAYNVARSNYFATLPDNGMTVHHGRFDPKQSELLSDVQDDVREALGVGE